MDYFVGFKVSSNTTNEKFVLKNKQLMDNDDNFVKINLTQEDIDMINQKIQNSSGQGNQPGPGEGQIQQPQQPPQQQQPQQQQQQPPQQPPQQQPPQQQQPKVVTLPTGWRYIKEPSDGGPAYFESIDGKQKQGEVPTIPYFQPQP